MRTTSPLSGAAIRSDDKSTFNRLETQCCRKKKNKNKERKKENDYKFQGSRSDRVAAYYIRLPYHVYSRQINMDELQFVHAAETTLNEKPQNGQTLNILQRALNSGQSTRDVGFSA